MELLLTNSSSLSSSPLMLTVPTKNETYHCRNWVVFSLRNATKRRPLLLCCSNYPSSSSSSSSSLSTEAAIPPTSGGGGEVMGVAPAPTTRLIIRRRKRYRKQYPGESKGITEEMRFVAMRLRNVNGKYTHKNNKITTSTSSDDNDDVSAKDKTEEKEEEEGEEGGETWEPSMEGFVKYLVDSKLVFNTVERIVDKSDDVSYAYFRRTGLERSEGLAKDLEWFSQQGVVIPEPSNPGVSYSKYLEDLAEKNAPLFLSHFYNIYFSHIAGGQVIAKQVSEKLLRGRQLEFYQWDGDVQEFLKGLREKLNMLGEHWSRDEKNKCLKEAAKSFKYLGQIVRLIIL